MKYGFVQPIGDARLTAEFAALAEESGWDGLFVWEPVWGVDAWVSLAAAAMVTERIRLGTMITPISRMRPWKLASESVTLDRLSNGRVILSVGLGATDTGFEAFGEVTDRRARAELLDEGLEILTGLWNGQPFSYTGKHYHISPTEFFPPPPPVQQPRIPIWVVGAWPAEKSMQRALRYDGILPSIVDRADGRRTPRQVNPQELRQVSEYIAEKHSEARHKNSPPFEVVVEGATPAAKPAKGRKIVSEWVDAGATWWIESMWEAMSAADAVESLRRRIAAGPPK